MSNMAGLTERLVVEGGDLARLLLAVSEIGRTVAHMLGAGAGPHQANAVWLQRIAGARCVHRCNFSCKL